MKLGADRWNLICATPEGLRTPRADLLPDAVTVVCEDAIMWAKHGRADVWATMEHGPDAVKGLPPWMVVWGMPAAGPAWLAAGVQFHPLPLGSVMGTQGIPRPVDAFFAALELACETCHAKTVRVFGCEGWRGEERWKRLALALCRKEASKHGIEIQRPYLQARSLR